MHENQRLSELPDEAEEGSGTALCGAHCRTTGQPCKNAPVTGSHRCRMHGGRKSGRPVIHGRYTQEAIDQRREARQLLEAVNALIEQVDGTGPSRSAR